MIVTQIYQTDEFRYTIVCDHCHQEIVETQPFWYVWAQPLQDDPPLLSSASLYVPLLHVHESTCLNDWLYWEFQRRQRCGGYRREDIQANGEEVKTTIFDRTAIHAPTVTTAPVVVDVSTSSETAPLPSEPQQEEVQG